MEIYETYYTLFINLVLQHHIFHSKKWFRRNVEFMQSTIIFKLKKNFKKIADYDLAYLPL